MKIRYYINDDLTHYVEFHIDLVTKNLTTQYVSSSTMLTSHAVDASEVFAADPLKNPHVQIAKKGRVWDFHLFNFDPYGVEVRRSVSLLLEDDVTPTKVDFLNDGDQDYMLVDYLTHGLEVYNSSLQFAHFLFDDIEKLSGTSGFGLTSPEITTDGKLKLGYESSIILDLVGEGEIDLQTIPTAFFLKVDAMSNNDASLREQIALVIGTNRFTFSTTEGVHFQTPAMTSPSLLLDDTILGDGMTIKVEVSSTSAALFVNNQKATLPEFERTQITNLILEGYGNNGEYTLIDDCIVQGLENFRTDFIPPANILEINAVTGDSEVFLTWKENTEEDLAGYHVYVDGIRQNLTTIPTADYQITGLADGVEYNIGIVAVDKSGNESIPSSILLKTISDPIFEVKNLDAYVNIDGTHFTWDVPNYPEYNGVSVYRMDMSTGETVPLAELTLDTISYVDTETLVEGYYKYFVKTFDVYGNYTSGIEVIKWVPHYDQTETTTP